MGHATEQVVGGLSPYLVVRLKDRRLALPAGVVRQLVLMPVVVGVPRRPVEYRGVVNVRGEVMAMLDLRARVGMESGVEEMEKVLRLLDEREQDHRNWLSELEASVKEKRGFKLARNPHQCKFGKWYDTYKPENETITFLAVWRAFDGPHQRIHAIADRVCDLAERGDFEGAQAIIAATRDGDLKRMIGLFGEARAEIRQSSREVAVVVEVGGRTMALSVDEVEAVEVLGEETFEELPEGMSQEAREATPKVARRTGSDKIVLVVDMEKLCGAGVGSAA